MTSDEMWDGDSTPWQPKEQDMIEASMVEAYQKVKNFRVDMILLLYCIVAVVTFGHSASQPRTCYEVEGTRFHVENPDGSKTLLPPAKVECGSAETAVKGFAAGAFWPLYWSWEIWD